MKIRLLFYLSMATIAFISCSKDAPPEVDPGDGTLGNPFIISTPEQLDGIRKSPSAHYKLGKSIDLSDYLKSSSAGWNPIASFTGSLDGAGYKITGLWINRFSTNYNPVGLFRQVLGGSVKNLGVEIADAGIIGGSWCGGLAGRIDNSSSSIVNCYVTGNVSGADQVGGIVGAVNEGSVVNCYTTGTISGIDCVGGVVGLLYNGGKIANCYATGLIKGDDAVGGIAGVIGYNKGTIVNCVALNPGISSNGSKGRVAGGYSSGSTFVNNWARMMAIEKTLDRGAERTDGADITPIGSERMEEWWKTSMWKFGSNDDNPWKWGASLPTLYWQTASSTAITKVTGITINSSEDVSLEMGKNTVLTASVTPINATYPNVIWSSSDTDVARVNAQTGMVSGISAGTATISVTATDGSGVSANKSVAVTHAEIGFFDGVWYAAQTHSIGLGIDLVFMGDGYAVEDIYSCKYERDMHAAIEAFFDIQPYKTYRNYFNAYIVGAVSEESGIGAGGVANDTKFSTYHGNGSTMVTNNSLCFTYAHKAPIADINNSVVILVANSTQHGGTCYWWNAGRTIAISPSNAQNSAAILRHEAGGHGFAKLADEYIDEATADRRSRDDIPMYHSIGVHTNVDVTNKPTEVIWKDFIGHPKYPMVGLFEGGYYFSTGVWRPEQQSLMQGSGAFPLFNAPSRAAIVKRIKELAGEPFDMEWFMDTDIIESYIPTRASSELISLPPLAPPVLVID